MIPPVRQTSLVPPRIAYSVGEKSREILGMLKRYGVMRMNALITSSRSRSEAVAAFIAVLELCREGRILLAGSEEDPVITASTRGNGETEDGTT